MKLVAIGDIHANNWKDYSSTLSVKWDEIRGRYVEVSEGDDLSTPMNSRLFNILSGLADVRDYCVKNKIHLCLCAGDIFHTRGAVDTTVFNSVYRMFEAFQEVGIKVVMIAGNHDQANASIYAENSLYPFSGINPVISAPKVVTHQEGDEIIEICCIPYSKDKQRVMGAIDKMLAEKTACDRILLAHVGVSGGLVGSGNYVMSDEYNLMELRVPKFKYVVFGHYHKPQVLEYNTIYTGSLLQNTFNDEGDDHGFWVLDTSYRYNMELVPLDYPKFITVTKGNVSGISQEDMCCNFIRVQAAAKDAEYIIQTIHEAIEDEKVVDSIRLEVERDYSADRTVRSGITISMDTPTILKTYVDEHNNTGIDSKVLLEKGLELLFKTQGGGEE